MQSSATWLPEKARGLAPLWRGAVAMTCGRVVSAIIAFGIVVRVAQYLGNHPLWVDEAMLALNIVHKSPFELLGRLEYEQAAPVGFLLVESVLVRALGNSEYVLRLFPLLGGVVSLFLFYAVARRMLSGQGLIAAVALFSISPILVRYSAELKQYSTDVAIALAVLLAAFLWSESHSRPIVKALLLGISGSICIWFSHTSVFMLAALGIGLTYELVKSGQYRELAFLTLAGVSWLVSFGLNYQIALHALAHDPSYFEYWSRYFAPFPPLSASELLWYPESLFAIFKKPLGMEFAGLTCVLFGVGLLSMVLHKTQHWVVLVLPLVVTMLAAILHKYPFSGRLLLFLVPILILFVAQGLGELSNISSRVRYVAIVIVWCVLLYHPAADAARSLVYPLKYTDNEQGIRGVMEHIADRYQEGDVIYVYHYCVPAVRYYADRYRMDGLSYRWSAEQGRYPIDERVGAYLDEVKQLRGNQRVWLIFSHLRIVRTANERGLDVELLDTIGNRLDAFETYGGFHTLAYLYDLR